jgi:tRNA threonylcarbamoyladenosine biosynthesis protein TsaB
VSFDVCLSLDCSHDGASACLRLPDGRVLSRASDSPRAQAADLMALSKGLLSQAKRHWSDLSGLVLCHGPGSFTGLRVAAGLAQGLARGLNIPVACVSGFEAKAFTHWLSLPPEARRAHQTYVVDVDARLGEWYRAVLSVEANGHTALLEQPLVVTAGQPIPPVLPPGSSLDTDPIWLAPNGSVAVGPWSEQSAAQTILQTALHKSAINWLTAEQVQPLYVRQKVAQTIEERRLGKSTELLPMRPEDLASVMVIEQQAYPYPWTSGNFRDALASGYHALKLVDQGVMVGYLVWMRVLDEAHLLNFTIAPARQSRGLGQHLLKTWLAQLMADGLQQVLLEVRPSNPKAIRLYQRNGFVQTGLRKGYYPSGPNGREDALLMNKPLSNEAGASHAA